MVALQTSEAVVPGSNPASLTVENSEDRQSHCAYCKISGQIERPPPEAKKEEEKRKKRKKSNSKYATNCLLPMVQYITRKYFRIRPTSHKTLIVMTGTLLT